MVNVVKTKNAGIIFINATTLIIINYFDVEQKYLRKLKLGNIYTYL